MNQTQDMSGSIPASMDDLTTPPRILEGETLLEGRKEVRISFRGKLYRLSVTGNGKLILTK